MKPIALALILLFTTHTAATAQEFKYAPFPNDYEQLDAEKKQQAKYDVDDNTQKYFHSKAYGDAISRFVREHNPGNIRSCTKLYMSGGAQNKMNIVKPLIFAYEDDLHPMVGLWEQSVTLTGCATVFAFVMQGKGNKSEPPLLTLKR